MGRTISKTTRTQIGFVAWALAILSASRLLGFADPLGNGNFLVSLADPQVSLEALSSTNGQIQFALNGESGVSYVIESSADMSNWTPVLTNNDFTVTRAISLSSAGGTSFYRARRAPLPLFQYALGARDNINMAGSSKVTDSFNSADPNFSTNGQYDPGKARTNGNVASVQGLVYLDAKTIGGNLLLGPAASFASGTNQILGNIEFNQNLNFPDVRLPKELFVAVPPVNVYGTNLIPVSGYYDINDQLPIDVPAGVTAVIAARTPNFSLNIQIHGGTTNSGTAYIFLLGSNATLSPNRAGDASNQAKNLCIFGLPSLTALAMSGPPTENFTGVIYTPSATLSLIAGSAPRNFFGSCITKSVTVNGNWFFHFDEDLLNSGPFR